MDEKKRIAEAIVARYQGAHAAAAAREYFERTVQRKEIPTENIAEIGAAECKRVVDLLVKAGFAQSKREAQRFIAGNAVKVDGVAVTDPNERGAQAPAVLSVGTRRFVRVLPEPLGELEQPRSR